jgi:hypothetical protein
MMAGIQGVADMRKITDKSLNYTIEYVFAEVRYRVSACVGWLCIIVMKKMACLRLDADCQP